MFILKWANPGPFFVCHGYIQAQILQKKTIDFSGIQTRIVGGEGDHLTLLTDNNVFPLIETIESVIRYSQKSVL